MFTLVTHNTCSRAGIRVSGIFGSPVDAMNHLRGLAMHRRIPLEYSFPICVEFVPEAFAYPEDDLMKSNRRTASVRSDATPDRYEKFFVVSSTGYWQERYVAGVRDADDPAEKAFYYSRLRNKSLI